MSLEAGGTALWYQLACDESLSRHIQSLHVQNCCSTCQCCVDIHLDLAAVEVNDRAPHGAARDHAANAEERESRKQQDFDDLVDHALQKAGSKKALVPSKSKKKMQEVNLNKLTRSKRQLVVEEALQVLRKADLLSPSGLALPSAQIYACYTLLLTGLAPVCRTCLQDGVYLRHIASCAVSVQTCQVLEFCW